MDSLFGKRLLALIIDAVAVSLVLWILSALIYPLIAIAGLYFILNFWLILAAVAILGYFTYLEGNYGQTLGKNIMKIRVVADKGELTRDKAIIRNLSKMLWFPLIVDVLAGYLNNDSKIRYLDKVAGTDVVSLSTYDKKRIKSSNKPESVV